MEIRLLSQLTHRVLAGHTPQQRHRVSCGGSDYATFPACVADDGLQLTDRLVIPDVLDFDACRNRLSDPDRLDETPVGFEKHRARPREVFRNDGIHETGRDPALYDKPAEG